MPDNTHVFDAAKNGYRQTAEGIEDLRQMEKAKDVSRQTISELDDLVKKGGKAGDDEMEKAILNIQRDKTAQSIMNSADVPDDVRKKANETIKKIYGDADVPTASRIKQSEDVRKYARDHGLDPDKMEVTVWSPTNKKGGSAVDPDLKKYGRDRDVTYQITGQTKDGRTVTLDVNHDISGPIYQEELYKRCHGGQLPANPPDVGKFADDMAHYFEAMEQGPGKAFRSIKTAELAKTLDGVDDLSKRNELINEAYRGGQISGDTFRQMRESTFRLPPNPTPQQKEQLKDWAIGAWDRRAISLTERKLIEEQVGSLDK